MSHLREKTLPQYFKSKLGHTSMNDKCAKKKLYTMCVFQKKNSEDTKAENDSVTAAIGYSCSRGDSDTSVHTIIKKKKKKKHMVTCNIKKIHVIQKTNGVLKPISVMKMLEFFVICIIKCI